jgi:hypothetical protein
MKDRLLWYGWGSLALALEMLSAFPIRTGKLRLVLAALLVLVWTGFIALLWIKRKWMGAALLVATLFPLLFLFLPGRPIDPQALRRAYVERLPAYAGTIYIWGGENSLGIDCSGLVRRALIDALFHQGWHTANPRAVREAISLWWHDESALEMGRATGGWTQPVNPPAVKATMGNPDGALPGDLAVMPSGSHVLAFLGDGKWIEAEPSFGSTHVFTLTGPFQDLATERVTLVRWKWLSAEIAR